MLFCFRPVRAERLFGLDDSWMGEQISAPPQALPIDEAFAALSRAASINAFVDATNLPVDQVLQPYAKRPKNIYEMNYNGRSNVIGNTVSQAKMTFDRTAKETFVFWREPDINRTVNLIVTRQKQLDALYPPADDKTTLAALEEFYGRTQDWPTKFIRLADRKRRAQGVEKTITLADLPAELQLPLQAEFVRRVRLHDTAPDYSYFEPQSWKEGRVRLVEENVNLYDTVGRVTQTKKAWVVRVYFSRERYPAYIGKPRWAVPTQVELANFTLPSFLSEGERLSQFEAAQNDKPVAANTLTTSLDFQEDAFQKTVKFPAKRVDLRNFISDLSKQSGLAFSVAPDVAPDAQILAASPGMPLGAALTAVERLYSARWVKAAQGYQLQSQGLDELHQNMAQLGMGTLYERTAYWSAERDAIGGQIADEVTGAFDWDQLKSEQGAPFSELPLDVQSHIVELFRIDKSGELIVTQQRLDDALAQASNFSIRLNKVSRDVPQFFGAFHSRPTHLGILSLGTTALSAFSPDGRFITDLFPQFYIYPPRQSEEKSETYLLQIEVHNAQVLKEAQNRNQ